MNYLASRTEGDILIIDFQVFAIIDILAVESVANEWMRELESSNRNRLIIDFSSLEFLSSGFLGELVQLRAFCMAKGISLKLCCLSKELKHVLALTGLDSQFKTYHSQRGAIECFSADNFVSRQAFFARFGMEHDAHLSTPQMATTPTLELVSESSKPRPLSF